MPYQNQMQGNSYPGYSGYGQQSPAQVYQGSQTQYAAQSRAVVPQQPNGGHVVQQQASTSRLASSTSPHLYQAPNGHYQQQPPPPVQQSQYQAPYQGSWSPDTLARTLQQQSTYQPVQQQYYQPQQFQQPPPQGYYQTSPAYMPPYSPAQTPGQASYQSQPRPQQRSVSHQVTSASAPVQPSPQAQPKGSSQPAHHVSSSPGLPQRAAPPTPQHRTVAQVRIPVQPATVNLADLEMPRTAKRRKSNEGDALLVCDAPTTQKAVPQKPSASQRLKQAPVASSPLTEQASSRMPPTPPQPSVDYQAVLLSLADEYTMSAYSMSASLASSDCSEETVEQYHKLIATAMGCLESVLGNYRQSDPRKEARIRLRLATLLYDETENSEKAEEVLSKGIALCERNRLPDLKYGMHHLLARVMAKGSPKAAMKVVDKLISESEALKIVQWAYAFRFLRVSLGLQASGHTDTAVLLKNLTAISSIAEQFRHITVQILAATLEAMTHLRSGAADAVELAQRALATVRMHQLGPEMQRLPQIRALLDCLDLACAVMQCAPDQVAEKMQHMHSSMDFLMHGKDWPDQREFLVPLGVSATEDIAADTADVLLATADGEAAIAFNWLSKRPLYALGFLLSSIASMHRSTGDLRAANYLAEGFKQLKFEDEATQQSLSALTEQADWRTSMDVLMNLQSAFIKCSRSEWTEATKTLTAAQKAAAGTDDLTRATMVYLNAVCQQGQGELKAALALYTASDLVFHGGTRSPLRDLQAVAALNRILVLRSFGQVQEADTLLSDVEAYCLTHNNKAVVAAYYVIKSTGTQPGAVIKLKQYLQSAVQAAKQASNNQLLCIVMNLMTHTFFINIVGDQAVKSARASRTLAKKAENKLWMAVADRMYGDTLELCGEPVEAETARKEARSAMQSLPPALRQRFEEQ